MKLRLIMMMFPFCHLTDQFQRNIPRWGGLTVPNADGSDCQTGIHSKSDMINWYRNFYRKWGKAPVIKVNRDEVWFNKVQVLNEDFIKGRKEYVERKAAALKGFGTYE